MRGKNLRCLLGLGLVLALLAGDQVDGQTGFQRQPILAVRLHLQTWSRSGQAGIREFSLPVFLVVPVHRRLSLDLVSGTGFARLDTSGGPALNGLTDTKLRASYIIGDELALLSAGVGVPTGKTELSRAEQQVSGALAANALGFSTPIFGQGLELNLGLAAAREWGGVVLGAGLGYLRKGGFTPGRGSDRYRPGDELVLTLGLDRQVMDGDGKLTLDLSYTIYADDEQGGRKVFGSGDKLLVQARAQGRWRQATWNLFLDERRKADNKLYQDEAVLRASNGHQLEAGLAVFNPLSAALGWRAGVDLKLYGDSAGDRGEAAIVGPGVGMRYQLLPGRYFDLNLRYARGRMDTRTVRGVELDGGIWMRL